MKNKKSSLLSTVGSVLAAQKERISIIGIGLMGNALLTYGYDYVLYPFTVMKYGMFEGGIYMSIGSFLICWLMILFYDWSKKDWLGIEALKEAREYHGTSKFRRWIANAMKNHDIIAIIVLSINFDPFITTAYMRRGINKFNGMKLRDWKVFLLSFFISNAYWIVASYYGATMIIKYSAVIIDITGIAARIFVVLVFFTVLLKRRLFFIVSRLELRYSIFSGKGKKKQLLRYVTESFAWAFFIYAAINATTHLMHVLT
jgi:hypothetical protein